MRDLAKDFRDYAEAPMKGTPFAPIHRDTLIEVADTLDRLRAALREIDELRASSGKSDAEMLFEMRSIAKAALTSLNNV